MPYAPCNHMHLLPYCFIFNHNICRKVSNDYFLCTKLTAQCHNGNKPCAHLVSVILLLEYLGGAVDGRFRADLHLCLCAPALQACEVRLVHPPCREPCLQPVLGRLTGFTQARILLLQVWWAENIHLIYTMGF